MGIFKYHDGDLLQLIKPDYSARWIFKVKTGELKRLDDDILPHKYYQGFSITLSLDEKTQLYTPNGFKVTWHHEPVREEYLHNINTTRLDLEKIIPYFSINNKKD
jgi:hypothetical protein